MVAAVIVNFNGSEVILDSLKSLDSVNYPQCDVIVVDNNSRDNSVDRIRAEYPDTILIENKRNVGFGAGCNIGIEAAHRRGAEYVLLLNSDATIEQDAITRLVTFLGSQDQAAAVAPFIMYYAKKHLIWYGGGTVSLWRGWIGHKYIRKTFDPYKFQPARTDYLTGCVFLIRTKALEEVNGFDLDYVLYSEDVDLSLRLRKIGYELWVLPQARSYHRVSSSTGGELSPFKAYHRGRSSALLVKYHAKPWEYPTLICGGIFGAVWISLKLTVTGKINTVFAIWTGILQGLANTGIPDKFKLQD